MTEATKTLQTRATALLYPHLASVSKAQPAKTEAEEPMSRAEAGAVLYRGSGPTTAGSLSSVVNSYCEQRAAKFIARGDPDSAQKARAEGPPLEAWAARQKITPQDLQAGLSVMREREMMHEHTPVTPEILAARTAIAKQTLQAESGSEEAMQARVQRFVALTETLAQEVPDLARRANDTAAGVDPRVIRALDHYEPVPLPTTSET
jgi:hypothetical protein